MLNKAVYRVLVVDDDISILSFLSILLERNGYTVFACSSGNEGLSIVKKENIDVVLTDVRMPGISGIKFLEQIHEEKRDLPVILMTAYADLDTAIEAIKKGVFDFILKPYRPEQVLHAVKKAVKYKRFIEMERDYKHLLEDFNREMETLISERTMNLMAMTIADKVRNPADVIGGIAKKLYEKGNMPPEILNNIKSIIEEADKLNNIVKEFYETLKRKRYKFNYEDLNEIIISVLKTIDSKEVKFKTDIYDEPLKVNIEKNLVRIAIVLLIRNAMEAIRGEGEILVKTYKTDEKACIEISDTGEGIPPELLDKIFLPFFSTKEKGYGMGLPLVKQIIDEHLGEISVKSEYKKGTTFILSFPLRWKEGQ